MEIQAGRALPVSASHTQQLRGKFQYERGVLAFGRLTVKMTYVLTLFTIALLKCA